MGKSVGIIEWVGDTTVLKDCYRVDPEFENQFAKARQVYEKNVKGNKTGNLAEIYGHYFKERKHTVTAHFEATKRTMKKSYMKHAIFKFCSSAEYYLKFKLMFSRSLASLNICSYILGIGDRHNENFLIDMKRFNFFVQY